MSTFNQWALALRDWLHITRLEENIDDLKKSLEEQELRAAAGQALLANQQQALEKQIRELSVLLAQTSANNPVKQINSGTTDETAVVCKVCKES